MSQIDVIQQVLISLSLNRSDCLIVRVKCKQSNKTLRPTKFKEQKWLLPWFS